MGLIQKVFGTYSEREVKRIKKTTRKILDLESVILKLSDDELRAKTQEFKYRLENGETLEDILVEAFAVCREASWRVLKMKHFEVQLIGGIVLHQGRIAEMKTGEGKTLVATLPSYLNALSGKGVHVVTVNDYLATRDRNTLKPLYDFLGVSCEVITHDQGKAERKQSYNADIIYITNTELGFDYLRDNMVKEIKDKYQRSLNFAIIDEVDSILIDEARTPLIISGEGNEATQLYSIVDVFVKSLSKDDYIQDEKLGVVILTSKGIGKAENIFNIKNLSDIENSELNHYINQSLKANYYMKKDKNYLIKNEQVLIIDEFTGRIAEGRRYSDGLHQAIEAKEGVKVQAENKTLATITYQNFFRLYKKLSGMTGTAQTEEAEFRETYEIDVVVIPTNKPIARIDKKDKVYVTQKAKLKGIVKDIKKCYKKGQPVLVGTSSIEKSENLSDFLKAENIPHQVLNAKYHEIEAQIIAKAGEKGSVTIATNMAGRGTDIKLGNGVTEVGGLKVIGTERHENRRIDNQLRGRSGRQGDSGMSQFYVSFEDDLMRVFASDRIKDLISNISKDDETVVQNSLLTGAIEKSQKNLESMHFESRKETMKYDNIVNKQRQLIYEQRDRVLLGINLLEQIDSMIEDVFSDIVDLEFAEYKMEENEGLFKISLNRLLEYIENDYFNKDTFNFKELNNMDMDEIKKFIIDKAKEILDEKKEIIGEVEINNIIKNILLNIVDEKWVTHLDYLVDLKRSAKLQAYRQMDPLNAFVIESGKLFNELISNIKVETLKYILKIDIFPQVAIDPINEIIEPEELENKVVIENEDCTIESFKPKL
ncbi:TPA: preprotein translocase subunit SecA [Clostridium botulinum]|nr:preprotein translocase subunit SecA [Clostridium botulinum]